MPDDTFYLEEDYGSLAAVFERMGDRADDIYGPLRQSGEHIQHVTELNFRTQGSETELGFWLMLSPPYDVWKETHYPGEPMLVLEHGLEAAIYSPNAVTVEGNEARYTIDDEKAPWHQFGAERSKGGTLPPRPIIPDRDMSEDIRDIWADWVHDILDDVRSGPVRLWTWGSDHPWWRPRGTGGRFR